MISYALTIDSVSYDFEIGANFTIDASETFDSGEIVIKNTTVSTPFAEANDVVLTIGTTNYYFTVQADKVEQITSTLFDHTVSLIEHTAKLTKYYSPNRYFTVDDNGDLWTAYDMLNRIRTTSPFLRANKFTIPTATQTALGVSIPQQKLVKKNLFEIATNLFRSIKAIPRLTSTNSLIFTYYNALNNSISLTDKIASQKEIDLNNYATHVISDIDTLTYEGEYSYNTPVGLIAYPRTRLRVPEGKFNDTDAEIQVDKRIRKEFKLIMHNISVDDGGGAFYISGDITDYVVSKKRWDGLPIGSRAIASLVSEFAQKNTVWFNESTTTINGFGEIIDTTSLINPTRLELIARSYVASNTAYVFLEALIDDVEFEFSYEPYISAQTSSVKQDNSITKYSEILNNPNTSVLDLQRYGAIQSDIVNRLSNGNYIVKIIHDDADIYELNDYEGDYKIIKGNFQLYPHHIVAYYELAKNFVYINGYETVDRTTTPYTIDTDNVNFNVRILEYIELSTTSRTTTGSITTTGWTNFFETFDPSPASTTQVLIAQFYSPDSNQSTYAITSTVLSTGKNGLRFMTGFEEPLLVGNQFANDTSNDIMEPIRYTDTAGFMEQASWYFYNSITTVPETLPLSAYSSNAFIELDLENYYKNPNEILNINYEALFVSDDDIIIGDYLSSNNALIKNLNIVQTITVYVSSATTKYTIFDQEVKETVSSSTTFTIDSTNRYIDVSGVSGTDTATWAIGDSLGNLYFAVNYNGSSRQRIYFNNLVARTTEESL